MIEKIQFMEYLKIKDNRGFFLREEVGKEPTWYPIDTITKDDLYIFLKKIVSDDFQMQEYDEILLSNTAHQIIYKNLYEKFTDLISSRTKFKDESQNLYKSALEKYRIES